MGFRKINKDINEINKYNIIYIKAFSENSNKNRYVQFKNYGDYLEDEYDNCFDINKFLDTCGNNIFIKVEQ